MRKIKRLRVWPCVFVGALLYGPSSLVLFLLTIVEATSLPHNGIGGASLSLTTFLTPFALCLKGCLAGGVGALLYNYLAEWLGLELEVEVEMESAPLSEQCAEQV